MSSSGHLHPDSASQLPQGGGGSDHTCFQPDPTQKDIEEDAQSVYIAIEPPSSSFSDRARDHHPSDPSPSPHLTPSPPTTPAPPPSFHASQFGIILRHQRLRPPDNSGLKLPPQTTPSRFLHLSNAFEFAGWGSAQRVLLSPSELRVAAGRVRAERREREEGGLGQWTASALAGNAVLGSVFYALPAVVAVAGVYSPISLFIATLVLFLWRPIMEELAAALPISGAPYTYILNISTKSLALVTAALLLLDFASTAIVSAATAAAYLSGELAASGSGSGSGAGSGSGGLPIPPWLAAVLLLTLFTLVSLWGVRESAHIALGVLGVHMLTMLVLTLVSIIHWARVGSAQLRANWSLGTSGSIGAGTGAGSVMKQLFFGVCLGMLGLTGFECTPSYISRIKPHRFPRVLRNLHLPAIVLNTTMMVLVLALIPLQDVLGGNGGGGGGGSANVLSVLAEVTGGKWLRIWIVVDAIIVLCGGVLTGILAASELLTQLAQHRVLPAFFLLPLRLRVPFRVPFRVRLGCSSTPHTHPAPQQQQPTSISTSTSSPTPTTTTTTTTTTPPPAPAILAFALFSGALYASARGSLAVVSQMFSLVWVAVMGVFPLAGLGLKFERGRLGAGRGADEERRAGEGAGEGEGEGRKAGLGVVFAALLVALVVFAGNVAYNPKTAGYFSAYFLGTLAFFGATQHKVHLLRCAYWVYDQHPGLHRAGWGDALVRWMRALKRRPVGVLVKSDEINTLFHMIMYVRKNEETSCLKIVHFYEEEKGVPSELEANAKILDEAFPEITIDLVLVVGTFDPVHITALSQHLHIPRSLMFMTCPGPRFPYSVAELGTRIISL